MDQQAVIKRMDEIAAAAKIRMDAAADISGQQYAEILYMTADEMAEFHELLLKLPSAGQERLEAHNRIIAKRKLRNEKCKP